MKQEVFCYLHHLKLYGVDGGVLEPKESSKTNLGNTDVVVGVLSYAATMLDLHAGSKILHPLQLSAPPIISRYYKVWPPSHIFSFLEVDGRV